jgi:ribosomal protein L24E
MLIRKYSCDTCGKDISDGSGAMHRLVLSEDHIWREAVSAIPPRLLDRELHFCSIKCLDQWIISRGPA